MSDELKWQKVKVAEDELSFLWKESADIETSEQAQAAALESQKDRFWPGIKELAESCDALLKEHDFPPAAQLVRHNGAAKWWPHPEDAPQLPPSGEAWKFIQGHKFIEAKAPGFSDAWYAARIGFKCRLALEHHAKGNAGAPFLFTTIFEIATLRTDWRWRRGNKLTIITGKKVRKNLSDHRSTSITSGKEGVKERRAAIQRILHDTNLTGGGLEVFITNQLKNQGLFAARRTIRRDLMALRWA